MHYIIAYCTLTLYSAQGSLQPQLPHPALLVATKPGPMVVDKMPILVLSILTIIAAVILMIVHASLMICSESRHI